MNGELRQYVIEVGLDDWLYFAELQDAIVRVTGSGEDSLRRAGELAVRLVKEGVLVPGTLEDEGFVPWPLSVEESAARIEREVAAMIRDGVQPAMSELCWFEVPERFAEEVQD